jgi:hypothetical protein
LIFFYVVLLQHTYTTSFSHFKVSFLNPNAVPVDVVGDIYFDFFAANEPVEIYDSLRVFSMHFRFPKRSTNSLLILLPKNVQKKATQEQCS